jgi:hypothetical protein
MVYNGDSQTLRRERDQLDRWLGVGH